jgi:pimeloyl-ACP methyl ester carboxylesterase
MQFASEHGDAVEAFVIVDVGPELSPKGVGRLVDFGRSTNELDSLEAYIERSLKYNPRRTAQQLRYSLTHNLRMLPDGTYRWKYDRRIVRRPEGDTPTGADADPNHFQDMWGVLPKITCRTLIVRGAGSDVFPEETARRMIEVLPDARLVTVADASHTVPQDNPVGFLEVVRPFLAGA